jgi:hypothetical protein
LLSTEGAAMRPVYRLADRLETGHSLATLTTKRWRRSATS